MRRIKIFLVIAALLVAVALMLVAAPIALAAPPAPATDGISATALSPPTATTVVVGIVLALVSICLVTFGYYMKRSPLTLGRRQWHPWLIPITVVSAFVSNVLTAFLTVLTVVVAITARVVHFAEVSHYITMTNTHLRHDAAQSVSTCKACDTAAPTRRKTGLEVRSHAPILPGLNPAPG